MGTQEPRTRLRVKKGLMGSEFDNPLWVWHVLRFRLNSVGSVRKFGAVFSCEEVQNLINSDFCL